VLDHEVGGLKHCPECLIRHLIHVIGGAVCPIPAWGANEELTIVRGELMELIQHLKHVRWLDVLKNFKAYKPICSASSNIFKSKITEICGFPRAHWEFTRIKHRDGLVRDWANINAEILLNDESRRVERLGKRHLAPTANIEQDG
jgi:hypothetical protein